MCIIYLYKYFSEGNYSRLGIKYIISDICPLPIKVILIVIQGYTHHLISVALNVHVHAPDMCTQMQIYVEHYKKFYQHTANRIL